MVLADVTNTGPRPGTETVQLYIRDLVSSVTRPEKELKGFKKIQLQPAETKTVALEITPESLAFFGHNLIWHNQTPAWVFQDTQGNPISRDALISRMRDHILTVVGRSKGKIGGWDVVNEALNDDGTLRDSPWRQIIGDDYLALACQFAHEADPNAELY